MFDSIYTDSVTAAQFFLMAGVAVLSGVLYAFLMARRVRSTKRFFIVVSLLPFVVGAVISPTPDIFTQSMIAIPLILLYEISYLVVRFVLRR